VSVKHGHIGDLLMERVTT